MLPERNSCTIRILDGVECVERGCLRVMWTDVSWEGEGEGREGEGGREVHALVKQGPYRQSDSEAAK